MSAAETCRANGWGPGTRLFGASPYVNTVIEITAVGERSVLAKVISENGRPLAGTRESLWNFSHRDWQVAE